VLDLVLVLLLLLDLKVRVSGLLLVVQWVSEWAVHLELLLVIVNHSDLHSLSEWVWLLVLLVEKTRFKI